VSGPNDGSAGAATNVVTDYVRVRGESRSHDRGFIRRITAAYKSAFQDAARAVTDADGNTGRVKFTSHRSYEPFHMRETAPVVRRAVAAITACGATPNVRLANGGLDANWMVRHGVPTVTLGAGQNEAHTLDEWVDLAEFEAACAVAVELATRAPPGR
jgi:tripeptide aminopeptidase